MYLREKAPRGAGGKIKFVILGPYSIGKGLPEEVFLLLL